MSLGALEALISVLPRKSALLIKELESCKVKGEGKSMHVDVAKLSKILPQAGEVGGMKGLQHMIQLVGKIVREDNGKGEVAPMEGYLRLLVQYAFHPTEPALASYLLETLSIGLKRDDIHYSVRYQVFRTCFSLLVLSKEFSLKPAMIYLGKAFLGGQLVRPSLSPWKFLLFRALCLLTLGKSAAGPLLLIRSQVLASNLLLVILDRYGEYLRGDDAFMERAVLYHLLPVIQTNVHASHSGVKALAYTLLARVMLSMRDCFKGSLGEVMMSLLQDVRKAQRKNESCHEVVKRAFQPMCESPQVLVDIFVNYDCDMQSYDIFAQMVQAIAEESKRADGDEEVATLALECLVAITQSMVKWTSEWNALQAMDNGTSEEDGEDKGTHFEATKARKLELQQGIALFNERGGKKGVEYLQKKGFLTDEESVSSFLKQYVTTLDKVRIGEYLGKREAFNSRVLDIYLDGFDFGGVPIDLALRTFLYGFRIPGEGQVIDVFLEKFGARYYHQNVGRESIFRNADAAYMFSYSMVMLATDLHSPAVRDKMTIGSWSRNNRGTNDGEDFPMDYQGEIFLRIEAQPLKIMGGDEGDIGQSPDHKDWHAMQSGASTDTPLPSTFLHASTAELVRPMFAASWMALLAAFSMGLESWNTVKIVELCLEGMSSCIHVASIFWLETERHTFVTSLAKFTHLDFSTWNEIGRKNVASIRALMNIASRDGNFLNSSWEEVLLCISKLEELHLIGSGVGEDLSIRKASSGLANGSSANLQSLRGLNASRIAAEIEGVDIDRIFTESDGLADQAIVAFMQCLVRVSHGEIFNASHAPRMFSLQKMVEVAEYNMDRIRVVWSLLWVRIGEHFCAAGCHPNVDVALRAVDYLRQLAMKFLSKRELENYNFQKDVLKPFEMIIASNRDERVRDMVICCVHSMLYMKAGEIKSGWKSIFNVLTAGAQDDTHESIVSVAFESMELVLEQSFTYVKGQFFVDCIHTVVAFAKNRLSKQICNKAIEWLAVCGKRIASGDVIRIGEEGTFTDSADSNRAWIPLLAGLADVVSHQHIDVRTNALETLFGLLQEHARLFSPDFWQLIYNGAILPLFVGVRHATTNTSSREDQEWLATTCLNATQQLVDLFCAQYDALKFLLIDLLSLLASFILQQDMVLGEVGCTTLLQLLMKNAGNFAEVQWNQCGVVMAMILAYNQPREIYLVPADFTPKRKAPSTPGMPPRKEEKVEGEEEGEASPLMEIALSEAEVVERQFMDRLIAQLPETHTCTKFDEDVVSTKCSVLELLLQASKEVILARNISPIHVNRLLDVLMHSFHFSLNANNDARLRRLLGRSKVMKQVVRVEYKSTKVLLESLASLCDGPLGESAREHLYVFSLEYLTAFLDEKVLNSSSSYARTKAAVVVQLLDHLAGISDPAYRAIVTRLYPQLVGLVPCERKELREHLAPVLLRYPLCLQK